jgi:capsular polysaccharide biosynthesis protein
LELRWYWRVLHRQWRIIVTTIVVVAALAAAYTAYSLYGSYYKGQAVVEFSQKAPNYQTQNVYFDPNQVALSNAAAATAQAKYYTTQLRFPKAIQQYILQHDNLKIDWKAIRSILGANVTDPRDLQLEYKSSNQSKAIQLIDAAVAVLNRDFLPEYNSTALAVAPGSKVQEFPITTQTIDPPSTITTSLSSTAVSWLTKVLAGVVLGIALAFLWEYLDETIHDEQDVRNWMHTPTLGILPSGK